MSSQLIVYIAARRPSGVCTWCVCKVSHPVHCAPQCTTPLVIPVTSLPSYGSVRSILHPEWDSDHLLGGSDWNHHSEATGMGRDHQHSSLFRIHHLLTGIIVVPLEGQPSMHLGLDCHILFRSSSSPAAPRRLVELPLVVSCVAVAIADIWQNVSSGVG